MTAANVGARPPASVGGNLEVPRPLRLFLTAGWSLGESVGLPVAAYAVAAWLGGRDAGLVAGLVAIWLTAVIRKVVTGSVPSLLTISGRWRSRCRPWWCSPPANCGCSCCSSRWPTCACASCSPARRPAANPLVARLAAEVVALRQPATHYPGLHRFFQGATWLWAGIFLLLTAALAVLMFAEPASVFLLISTVATIVLVVTGTGVSTLWFLSVLRRLGLRLRFAPA